MAIMRPEVRLAAGARKNPTHPMPTNMGARMRIKALIDAGAVLMTLSLTLERSAAKASA